MECACKMYEAHLWTVTMVLALSAGLALANVLTLVSNDMHFEYDFLNRTRGNSIWAPHLQCVVLVITVRHLGQLNIAFLLNLEF